MMQVKMSSGPTSRRRVRRILMVSFDFPPRNTGGMMRSVRFANRFTQRGIKVRVVSAEAAGSESTDPETLSLLEPEVEVIRLPVRKLADGLFARLVRSGYLFYSDDLWLRWSGRLKEELSQSIRSFQPDVLMITMPPFSLHRLVPWLRKMFDIPVWTDLRDAWSQWIVSPFPTYLHYCYRLHQEKRILHQSSVITVTSRVTRQDLLRLHGENLENQLLYLPNSFEDYTSDSFAYPNFRANKKVTFLYLGSFYFNEQSQSLLDKPWCEKKPYQWLQYSPRREDWTYRSPQKLFDIFDAVLEANPELSSNIELIFAGDRPPWWERMLGRRRVSGVCRHLGRVPKARALSLVHEADILMLTSSKVLGGPDYSIAGKTFEYFAARKPILGFVCEGAQKDILAQSGVAVCLDPDEPQAAQRKLQDFIAGDLNFTPVNGFLDAHISANVIDNFLPALEERL